MSATASRACGYSSNFRLTERQSAIGRIQLQPLPDKFYVFVEPEALSGSCSEIYLEKCFQDAGLAPAERLPVARLLGETSLMFLVHPTITPEQMASYAEVVRSVVKRACR
jgi:dTDP-4-amino-4,6-dideoxygalactose transaminase